MMERLARLSKRFRAVSGGALLSLALASCSTFNLDQIGWSQITPREQDAVAESLPPAQRKEHERLVSTYGGVYRAPELQALIEQTITRLGAASEKPELKYRVTILNSPAINAFALPGGSLYVTRGLISLANDTAELSSVLSHEMAHVVARHAAIREEQIRAAVLNSRAISDTLSDPQLGALALARSQLSIAKFSRGQELEADAVGVGIAARAGYDPFGASRFLTSMGRFAQLRATSLGAGQSKDLDFLSSHPSTPERISIAVANAKQFANPRAVERDRELFLKALDGVVFGDDPKEGFVRGRNFLHPNLGIAFTAPENFTLENTPQAVLGATPNGKEALRLDAIKANESQTLAEYISNGWVEGIDTTSIEQLQINGFDAVTATARGEQWSFRLYAIRLGGSVYRIAFAARDLTPEIESAFRQAATTFRRVPPEEAQAIKPLRIRLHRVVHGDTPEKLAARMAYENRPLERFLVINGMQRGARLTPGDYVKLIVE
ncbi:MAG: M48 family metalloprotease [Xanthobacteraceae bacterium]|nr:M48 family metalloprotease [Xanthobacteraceae bacterium]MBX3532925.1 M48 family metalloprotease [Xanthobacteraceae bacterium]MBX3549845.1 M48 family metalloprotease [Xanthobacteraceae bacterium]MCW5672982.1 M48 family metalloprotease [Xanthobacteraceae bacterium]MCW5677905.1 M48 family metalloprotease [Xanthobacteraceae bacterium]